MLTIRGYLQMPCPFKYQNQTYTAFLMKTCTLQSKICILMIQKITDTEGNILESGRGDPLIKYFYTDVNFFRSAGFLTFATILYRRHACFRISILRKLRSVLLTFLKKTCLRHRLLNQ